MSREREGVTPAGRPRFEVEKALLGIGAAAATKPIKIGRRQGSLGGDEVTFCIAQGKSAIADPHLRIEDHVDQNGHMVHPAGPRPHGHGRHENGITHGVIQCIPSTTGRLAGRQRLERHDTITSAPDELGTGLCGRIEMPGRNVGFARSGVGHEQTGVIL